MDENTNTPAASMAAGDSLEPPILLLAMPQVMDPFFHKSVVLLIHNEEEGGVGFIVNRPTSVSVSDVLEGLEIDWNGDDEQLAFFGGPVEPQLGTVLFSDESVDTTDVDDSTVSRLLPGLGLTQHVGDLATLAAAPPHALRLVLGYAGWGDGQLEQELLRNDWMVAPASTELLFADDPETLWSRAFASIGVDTDTLPTWTPRTGGEDGAN